MTVGWDPAAGPDETVVVVRASPDVIEELRRMILGGKGNKSVVLLDKDPPALALEIARHALERIRKGAGNAVTIADVALFSIDNLSKPKKGKK